METLYKRIKLVVSDVDGVLSDGSIITGEAGETKVFNVRDGMGIKLLQKFGIEFALLSGRHSQPTQQRAAELGITHVITGRVDKQTALAELVEATGIGYEQMAYVGDDLPDIAPIRLAAIGFCPQDSVAETLAAADHVVPIDGGRGVVRYIAEAILKAQGHWEDIVSHFEVQS